MSLMPASPSLRYVCDDAPAIRRRRAGKGFVYFDPKGQAGRELCTFSRAYVRS